MSNIIHPKILILLLVLASVCFIFGIICFAFAITNNPSTPVISTTSLPQQNIKPLGSAKGEIILTPIDKTPDEIKIGRDTIEITDSDINFDLSTISGNIINKAILRIYQKDITGNPYLGNFIEVDDLGIISKDDKLEWKELDITDAIKNSINLKQYQIKFNLHQSRQTKSSTRDGDFAIFEPVPQLVVDIN